LGESKTNGKPYIKLSLVHDTGGDDDSKLWLDGMAFGPMAQLLNRDVKKGSKLLISGNLKVKEYQKKDGTMAEGRTVFLETVKVAGVSGVIDEFTDFNEESVAF